jgi:hypothetical protein
MASVAVNPPKTPVTKGSSSIAAATLPNVCKMPGPPAPFVPTPLPNIGKSDNSPQGYSTTVKIEGNFVAIKGASFNSMGDVASQGTGGGLVSNNTQGPTKFIGPGSLDVKIEGNNVQYLGDPMMNNCGPSGSPANSATMAGVVHGPAMARKGGKNPLIIKCKDAPKNPTPPNTKFGACEKHELCEKCADINRQAKAGKLKRRTAKNYVKNRRRGDAAAEDYREDFSMLLKSGTLKPDDFKDSFTHECQFKKWKNSGADPDFKAYDPDHIHEIQLSGHPSSPDNLRWMSAGANRWIGGRMSKFKSSGKNKHTGVKPDCCK